MDLSALQRRLLPCDMEVPFVFVSYSAADKEVVWADVAELQRRGYNVWIDEANLDKSKASWKEDALKAIEDYNCALLLFYVSASSLTSQPCLNELDRTAAEATQETHLGRVEFVAVDAEPVGDMGEFIAGLQRRIEQSDTSSQEKSRKTRILFRFTTHWFHENNEKVRIHPRQEKNRVGDYYSDLERELNRNRRAIRLPPSKLKQRMSPEKLYRYGVECVMNHKEELAAGLLEAGAESYAPSALLLAHLYHAGAPGVAQDPKRAEKLWGAVEQHIPAHQWEQTGMEYDKGKFYSEALAYFLAYGEKLGDAESLFLASKMWIKKGSQPQALAALRLSAKLGSDKARQFLTRLYSYDEDEVYRHAYRDEAAVK